MSIDTPNLWYSICGAATVAMASIVTSAHAPSNDASPLIIERQYLAENNSAMSRMMTGMAVKPTGNVDRDFVDLMVPHHQGAIDMAIAVLRYGHNEKIRRIAQEIIVDQQQEIVAMRAAVGERLPPLIPSPTQE